MLFHDSLCSWRGVLRSVRRVDEESGSFFFQAIFFAIFPILSTKRVGTLDAKTLMQRPSERGRWESGGKKGSTFQPSNRPNNPNDEGSR